MAKNIKLSGIKKALGDYNRWLDGSYFHTAKIMLDRSTGEVWCDVFENCNHWKVYRNENIICLSGYVRLRTDKPLTMQLLKEYAEIAIVCYRKELSC